jgi:hypothetical protein
MDREEWDMKQSKAGMKWPALLLCALAAMALFAAPASAGKTRLFLETFGPAAQPVFQASTSLALDPSSGDLYVLDAAGFHKGTVNRFKPNGESKPFSALGANTIDAEQGPGKKPCAEEEASCDDAPQVGFTFTSFSAGQGLAVDDSGTLTDGNVYVTDNEIFGQGATRPADYLTVFASDGHYLGQITMAGGTAFKRVCGVTVDSAGNVFVAEVAQELERGPKGEILKEPEGRIYKFDPSANPPLSSDLVATFSYSPEVVCSLAAGAGPTAGSLFARVVTGYAGGPERALKIDAAGGAVEGVIPSEKEVGNKGLSVDPFNGHLFTEGRELDASGASPVSVSQFASLQGVASNSASERLFVGTGPSGIDNTSTVRVFGPIVTVPEATSGGYEVTGDTSVRVKGTVNPDGQALTECAFEYGLTIPEFKKPYEHSAPCEAPDIAEIGAASSPVEVHADLTGLAGESEYHYRLVARNANAALYPEDPSAVARGGDKLAKTPAKPAIKATWAEDVSTADATLGAMVNPGNSPTTYRFEWGLDTSYGESSPERTLGGGDVDRTVALDLHDLQPGTTYHYRFVASNGIGSAEGSDRALRTFPTPTSPSACANDASRIGFGALLPDCRAYEMVSPVDKNGGDIRALPGNTAETTVLEQSSLSGEKLAYGSVRSFGDAQSAPWTSQYIAQRLEGQEWRTHSINSPRAVSVLPVLPQGKSEFRVFSPDLCEVWQETFADPPLAPGAVAGRKNGYRRTDQLCSEDGAAHYETLAPVFPPATEDDFSFEIVEGVSADGVQAVISGAPTGGRAQAYVAVPGALPRPVCVLPDLTSAASCLTGSATPGGEAFKPGRISSDGSRVFWTPKPSSGLGKAEAIYLRQNPTAPESARLHGAATGKGDLIGPASGTGNAINGSTLVKGVKVTSGAFAVGQKVTDSGGAIAAGTTIVKIEESSPGVFTLTLSVAAKANKPGDGLTGEASEKVSSLNTETGSFQAGQEIAAPGIPSGTTVLSCSPSCGSGATSLTLSAKATKAEAGAALSATSPCTEAATKACTIAVSQAAEEKSGERGSVFWGASADGSKAIFSSRGVSEGDDRGGFAKLYSFEPDTEATELIAEGVYGVMGMSEDAKRIYFASRKSLDSGAVADQPNLYFYEEGSTTFIATLAAEDMRNAVGNNSANTKHSPRVTPDGLHAAFVARASLTGYDSTRGPGAPCGLPGAALCDTEVYLYDAATDRLLCASCNPSGARPAGASRLPNFQNESYGARALVEDGSRLYFESSDALTPRDTNGKIDVYQWEGSGTGNCEESLPTYSPLNGGCVDLISSGKSLLDSRFVEADPAGENVFIATGSSLLPQDPGLIDIYDARAGGGLPIPAGPAASCEGEACQGTVEAPNDPTPASLSFEGAGNVREETPITRKPCAKGKVRRHGKCVAKHRKRAKQRAKRHRRAGR